MINLLSTQRFTCFLTLVICFCLTGLTFCQTQKLTLTRDAFDKMSRSESLIYGIFSVVFSVINTGAYCSGASMHSALVYRCILPCCNCQFDTLHSVLMVILILQQLYNLPNSVFYDQWRVFVLREDSPTFPS